MGATWTAARGLTGREANMPKRRPGIAKGLRGKGFFQISPEDQKSREVLRKIFGRHRVSEGEARRSVKTMNISSPEKIGRYLRCPKERLYFRRGWVNGDLETALKRFNAFLEAEVKISEAFGRSRATYRAACRGPKDGAPFIDAMLFAAWRGRRLVLSVGPLDPLYYGETTTVFDVLAAEADKKLVDEIFERFFSEAALKNKIHKVGGQGQTKEVAGAVLNMEDVVLPAETRMLLEANTLGLLNQREIYKKNGIPLKRGLILEGPPGNGKTLACKALAATGRFTVFWVTPSEYSDLHEVYEKAVRQAPSLVLFEDIDLLGSSRSSSPRTLGQLLNVLDGLVESDGVITIATTNDAELLDKALAHRPNRFDVRLRFENPIEPVRLEMLRRFTQRQSHDAELDLPAWARRAEGLSGAEVRELCYLAIKAALDAGKVDGDLRAILSGKEFEAAFAGLKSILGHEKRVGFAA